MKRVLLALATLVAFPLAAQAGDLSYNYVQAGYSYTHNDNGHNSHGWNGTASAALGEHFQIFGGGGTGEREKGAGTSSNTSWNLGAGFHTPVSAQTDFVGDVGYHRTHIDGVDGKVQAWVGEVGVRSALAPKFEGWVMAGYANSRNELGNVDHGNSGEVFGKLGGQYKFTKNFGLVAEGLVANNNSRRIFVGPRVSF
jgi:Ax21 family sulfation-dependent quorum factor